MKIRPFFLGFFCFFLLAQPCFAEIGDKVPGCKVIYGAEKEQALQDLAGLEEVYTQFRWIRFKIRIFEYDHLWKARLQTNDPLSKEIRFTAQKEEERLLGELALLDKAAEYTANRLFEGFQAFKSVHIRFVSSCSDPDVQACLEKSLKPAYDKVQEARDYFESVHEREVEYQKAVEIPLGGREGLYPEDTVEAAVLHKDYFSRFEIERRQIRFEEDAWIANFFQDLRKLLTDAFAGDLCCLKCGKTDWDKKIDEKFRAK